MNLFTGDRGLISYFEKKGIEKHLYDKKITLTNEVAKFENKNLLLSDNLKIFLCKANKACTLFNIC